MDRTRLLSGGAVALFAALVVTACTDTKDVVRITPVDPLFRSYVSLGNSITAGFQSAGINDSTQLQAYPVLFAQQVNTRFAVPLLAKPGCPPPYVDLLGDRLGGGNGSTCFLRDPSSLTAIINNVAVPGATSFSPTIDTAAANTLTLFILGGKNQVARAVQAQPTFVSIWIGNNDVLGAALSGFLVPVPGISAGLTDTTKFQTNYTNMLNGLKAAGTVKGGALFAVANVAVVPLLIPAGALFNPQVKAALDAFVSPQPPVTVDTSCVSTPGSLISFQLVPLIKAGAAPDTIACHPLAGRPAPNPLNAPSAFLGNMFVLDPGEQALLQTVLTSYNSFIQAQAQTLGWAYVDINPTLLALKGAPGGIPILPDLTPGSPAPFGPYFSFDGVHPSALAHKTIANLMIDSVNAKYGTSIQPVP